MIKDKVFDELYSRKGQSVSGQELAEKLGVSRNAVWKAIKALKADGTEISAATNKGYILSENAYSEKAIKSALPDCVKLFYFTSIDSTNTQAKRLLADGINCKAVILANKQTAGRGRLGRNFHSPENTGIYFSYVFKPDFIFDDAVFITSAAAVAVVRAIEKTTALKPEIKWVNDIFLNGKKVCGILTEGVTNFENGQVENVVIGIGINVCPSDFPDEIKSIAGSLDGKTDRTKLLLTVLEELMYITENLSDKSIIEDYRAHSLVLGREIRFCDSAGEHRALAEGIDDRGGLLVKLADGTRKTLSTGEISIKI